MGVVQVEHVGESVGFVFVAFQEIGVSEGEFNGIDCVAIFSEVDVEDLEARFGELQDLLEC